MKDFPGKIGVMQGRLSPPKENLIQHYPIDSWEQEFSICRNLGLDCIEWVFEFTNFKQNILFDIDDCIQIQSIINNTGVSVNSVVADYFMVKKLFDESKEDIKLNILTLKKLLINCNKINIPIVEIPFVDASSMKNNEDKIQVVENLSSTLKFASELEIKISVETDLDPLEFRNFINMFDTDNIYINYDMGNSASLGFSPIEEIKTYGEKIINVHIKDRILNGSTVPLGSGDTNFYEVFSSLKEIDYNGDFIFQSARHDFNSSSNKNYINVMKEYLDFTKKYLA